VIDASLLLRLTPTPTNISNKEGKRPRRFEKKKKQGLMSFHGNPVRVAGAARCASAQMHNDSSESCTRSLSFPSVFFFSSSLRGLGVSYSLKARRRHTVVAYSSLSFFLSLGRRPAHPPSAALSFSPLPSLPPSQR
jgi:hypothetical protein